jgi:hypothetical protein
MTEAADLRIAGLEADISGLKARLESYERSESRRDFTLGEMNRKLDSLLEFKAEVTGGKKAVMALWVAVSAVIGGIIALIGKAQFFHP